MAQILSLGNWGDDGIIYRKYLRCLFGEEMVNIILAMMESVSVAVHSGRLFSRQLDVNYILEWLKDLGIIFMSFIRSLKGKVKK